MKNAVILHGTNGTPESNWFPWLKKELEKNGYKVWVPNLPENDMPNAKRYNEFLFHQNWDYNEETILIGHSSGAVAALQLLQALPEDTKIKAVYCIGAFKDNLQWRNEKKELILQGILEPDLDFIKLRPKAEKFVFIHSVDDPRCPPEHASYLAVKLQGELTMMQGQKHFSIENGGPQYKEFPLLLEKILSNQ